LTQLATTVPRPLPAHIYPRPQGGYEVRMDRRSIGRTFYGVYPTVDEAVIARDAWSAEHPAGRPGARKKGETPEPVVPIVPPPPLLDGSLEGAARSACLAYAAAKAAWLADRTPANGRAMTAAMEAAVVALQRWGGHRDGPNERASPLRAGDRVYHVDNAGELHCEGWTPWKTKVPFAVHEKRVHRSVSGMERAGG
jgi:hypothetical protein